MIARCTRCCLLICLATLVGCEGSAIQSHADSEEPTEEAVPVEHAGGLAVYIEKCGLCHDGGEAGSPRLGNPRQWAKRAEQDEETLIKHAIEGFEGKWGEMPPQGDDLTPEQVSSAVRYMLYRFELAREAE